MKRFFTQNYWLCRREQFIRWLAGQYIEQERQIHLRYRDGVLLEDKKRNAELARFSGLVATYGEALQTISRLRANHPACEIAFRAINPGATYPFRPVAGISMAEFKAANPAPPVSRPICAEMRSLLESPFTAGKCSHPEYALTLGPSVKYNARMMPTMVCRCGAWRFAKRKEFFNPPVPDTIETKYEITEPPAALPASPPPSGESAGEVGGCLPAAGG